MNPNLHVISCDICFKPLGYTDGYTSSIYCDDCAEEQNEEME